MVDPEGCVIGAPSSFVKAPKLINFAKWEEVFEKFKGIPDEIRERVEQSGDYLEEYEKEVGEEIHVIHGVMERHSADVASRSPQPAPTYFGSRLNRAQQHIVELQNDIMFISRYQFGTLSNIQTAIDAMFKKGYNEMQPPATTICLVLSFARWLAEVCYLDCCYLHFYKFSESRDKIVGILQTPERTPEKIKALADFIVSIPRLKDDGGVKSLLEKSTRLIATSRTIRNTELANSKNGNLSGITQKKVDDAMKIIETGIKLLEDINHAKSSIR